MLTDEHRAFYAENGYLHLPGVLPRAEAAGYRERCHALLARRSQADDPTWGSARRLAGGAGTTLRHCHDVQLYDAELTRLLTDERLTGPAGALVGSGNVQLHHTKMFVKPPEKGSPFPLHQDHPYFPHRRHSVVAAVLHLDDAPEEKGCVRVVPGSHRWGPLEHDPDGGWHLPPSEYPLESALPCPCEAGDVLFFSYLTVHGSGVNRSGEERTTLLVQMRDPSDEPTVDTHRSPGQGTMLRGTAA